MLQELQCIRGVTTEGNHIMFGNFALNSDNFKPRFAAMCRAMVVCETFQSAVDLIIQEYKPKTQKTPKWLSQKGASPRNQVEMEVAAFLSVIQHLGRALAADIGQSFARELILDGVLVHAREIGEARRNRTRTSTHKRHGEGGGQGPLSSQDYGAAPERRSRRNIWN